MKNLILVLLTVVTASCVNKNVDEYRYEIYKQELAKIKSISGKYRGLLKSMRGSSNLGPVELEILPDTEVKESPDGTRTETRATIKGTLTHSTAIIFFKQVSYNTSDGTLAISIGFEDGRTLRIFGAIAGKNLNAVIEADKFTGFGAELHLVRDAPVPDETVSRPNPINKTQVYKGILGNETLSMPVTMTVQLQNPRPEDSFYYLFAPARVVSISLDFGGFQSGTDTGYLDGRTGNLSANIITTSENNRYVNELQCVVAVRDSLNCSLSNPRRGHISTGVLKRVN